MLHFVCQLVRVTFSSTNMKGWTYGRTDDSDLSEPKFLGCILDNPGGGGDSHMKQTGMLVENFEFNQTIWAWLKLFVTPKGDQSGRGLSKF